MCLLEVSFVLQLRAQEQRPSKLETLTGRHS